MPDDRAIATIRVYAADIGRVAYLSLCALIVTALVLERVAPGVAGNVVSPQRLIAAAVIAGALALLAPADTRPAAWKIAVHAASAIVAATFVFSAAWVHFAPMPEAQLPAAFAAAFCAALPFLAYAPAVMKGDLKK